MRRGVPTMKVKRPFKTLMEQQSVLDYVAAFELCQCTSCGRLYDEPRTRGRKNTTCSVSCSKRAVKLRNIRLVIKKRRMRLKRRKT